MRISDWSSDVCSSDLARGRIADARILGHDEKVAAQGDVRSARDRGAVNARDRRLGRAPQRHEILSVAPHHLDIERRVPRHVLRPADRALALGTMFETIAAATDRTSPSMKYRN